MKLSVIIPNYNKEKTIEKCIKSVSSQNIDAEIIVIDDCSNDNSIKLIKNNFPKVKIIKNNKNRGAAYCRNIGILNSSNNYLLFLDSDVCLKKGCINSLFNSIKNADIVFPKIFYENEVLMYPITEKEKNYPQISTCFMIKRKSLKKLDNLFDEFYETFNEDLDFFMRCSFFGLKAEYVENGIAIHIFGEAYNAEKRYFLENKNLIYGMIKLKKIIKNGKMAHSFKMKTLFKNLVCGIFNFNWFDFSSYKRDSTLINRTKLLFLKHKKITKRPSFTLIYLFFKAILVDIKTLNKIIEQKRKLEKYIDTLK